jgi:pyrroline-5-carboxylate reductase
LKNVCLPGEIIVSEPVAELRVALQQETGIAVTADNLEVAHKAETILLGVKPSVVLPVLEETATALRGKLVISLAAGIRLASMEAVGHARFMRVLTNTPSAIAQGASALAHGSRTTQKDIDRALELFGMIGLIVSVEESHIDAVTALSGSGPAFVYTVIEALAEGGKKAGLPAAVASALATQTVLGAAQLAIESDLSPEELRRMVITPGGTTAAGLDAMAKHGTTEGLIAAVEAAAARGREMAKL